MKSTSRLAALACSTSLLFATGLAMPAEPPREDQSIPVRPKITGVAGIAVKTKDMASARTFYSTIIGLDEAFPISNPLGGAGFTTFKINEKQYVYVSSDLKDDAESRLWYVSFETSDARALRSYLASKGVAVPASVDPDPEGNLSFIVKDPEGQDVTVHPVRGGLAARSQCRQISLVTPAVERGAARRISDPRRGQGGHVLQGHPGLPADVEGR